MARRAVSKGIGLYHVGHGLGTSMPVGTTVKQMVAASGIDFRVEKFPMIAVLPNEADPSNPKAVEIPNRFATLRTDIDKVLGVVGKEYAIGQNSLAWVIPSILEEQGRFTVQSAACLKGGSQIMLTGKVAEESIRLRNGTEDVLSQMLVFSNAHTGKKSLVMGFTHFRHFCNNQNIAILKGLKAEHRIRHTSNLEIRVAEANEAMLIADEALAKGREVFQWMADTKMTSAEMRRFATALLDEVMGSHEPDAKKAAKHSEDARKEQVDELVRLFGEGQGNLGCSIWDGYNSVTEWLDHRLDKLAESKRTTERVTRFTADTFFGKSRRIKERAVRMLVRR